MAWLERNEHYWIYGSHKTYGATCNVPSKALAGHKLIFARQQKRYRRELLMDCVTVQNIKVFELIVMSKILVSSVAFEC